VWELVVGFATQTVLVLCPAKPHDDEECKVA
jgi:hypothetical protein